MGEGNTLRLEADLNLTQTCHLEVAHLDQGVCDAELYFLDTRHKDLGKCGVPCTAGGSCAREQSQWGGAWLGGHQSLMKRRANTYRHQLCPEPHGHPFDPVGHPDSMPIL